MAQIEEKTQESRILGAGQMSLLQLTMCNEEIFKIATILHAKYFQACTTEKKASGIIIGRKSVNERSAAEAWIGVFYA